MSSEQFAEATVTALETGDNHCVAPAAAPANCRRGTKPRGGPAIDLGRHIPALDGLRGVAILMVMLFHFYYSVGPGSAFIARWSPFFASQVARFFLFGMYGVDLFFVLSGFLITGILVDTKETPFFFRNFYARRFLRIFPLYYGVLIGVFLVWPFFVPSARVALGTQLWYWLFASNLIMPELLQHRPLFISGGTFSLGHFWSLAVEEQFYLAWPLMIFFFSRKTILRVAAGCLLLAPLCRMVLLATGHRDYVLWFTLARLDSIAMGALLAVALRDPVGRALAAKAVPWCLAAGVLVVVVLMGLPRRWELAPVIVVKYSALALLFGSLLAYLLLFGHSILGWLFRWRILQFFGKYSYGIYVFHCSFMHMTSLECLGRALHSDLLGLLLQLAIPVAASTAVAFASYHLYEKYFLRLKRYFASQRIPAGRESASPRCAAALQENPR